MKREIEAILICGVILAAFLLVASAKALDMDFTCGSYIISAGDRRYDVLSKCGDPSFVESWQEVRARGDIGSWMLDRKRGFTSAPYLLNSL